MLVTRCFPWLFSDVSLVESYVILWNYARAMRYYNIRFEQILQTRSKNCEKLGKGLFNYDFSSEARKKPFYKLENCLFFFPPLFQTIMDKSLGTLLHFWGVFRFTQVQPLPSRYKQCWTRVSRIFFRVSTLYRVGGGRTGRNFRKGCTVLRGNREMTEKNEYCSTVPRTFLGPG